MKNETKKAYFLNAQTLKKKKKKKGVKLKDKKIKRQSLLKRARPDFRALIAQFIILCNYMVR